MHSILKKIIQHKQHEVARLKQTSLRHININLLRDRIASKSLKKAIKGGPLSLIGEIKRNSPSKGKLAHITNPITLLREYLEGGITAISVLTENHFFHGSIEDLEQVTSHLEHSPVPVLQKDFIIDIIQINQAVLAGADAILLIVAVLQDKTRDLLHYAKHVGLDVIVEVHNLDELSLAIELGAEIVGINNRNLHTFVVDIDVCLQLAQGTPEDIVIIAESGVKTSQEIKKINAAGIDAVLIGEALVTSTEPSIKLQAMRELL